jgi:RNase P/RNase MRP subunit POP5
LAFEIISERPIKDYNAVSKAISAKALEYLGELGCAEAGIIMMPDKYSKEHQRGLIRVSNKSLDKLRATLALVQQIDNQEVIVRSVGASGILKKAEGKYLAA